MQALGHLRDSVRLPMHICSSSVMTDTATDPPQQLPPPNLVDLLAPWPTVEVHHQLSA